jgi:hypothetical protein
MARSLSMILPGGTDTPALTLHPHQIIIINNKLYLLNIKMLQYIYSINPYFIHFKSIAMKKPPPVEKSQVTIIHRSESAQDGFRFAYKSKGCFKQKFHHNNHNRHRTPKSLLSCNQHINTSQT